MTKVQAKDILDTAFLTAGTAPNYTIEIPCITSYAELDRATVKLNFHAAGTGTITLNVNGLGTKTIDGLSDVTADDYLSITFDSSQDLWLQNAGTNTGGGSWVGLLVNGGSLVDNSADIVAQDIVIPIGQDFNVVEFDFFGRTSFAGNPVFIHYAGRYRFDVSGGTTTYRRLMEFAEGQTSSAYTSNQFFEQALVDGLANSSTSYPKRYLLTQNDPSSTFPIQYFTGNTFRIAINAVSKVGTDLVVNVTVNNGGNFLERRIEILAPTVIG